MTDMDILLAQIQQALLQNGAPTQQPRMEEIQVSAQRPQSAPQDPLQLIMQQPQMPNLGGLSGMPTPGLGPASYNPMYKQGGGYGADDFEKTKAFFKEPSLGALMGK